MDGPASAINQPKCLQNETGSFMKLCAAGDICTCVLLEKRYMGKSKHLYGKDGYVARFKVIGVLNNGEW